MHDAAAYYVLGEQAVTNYGIDAAQRDLRDIIAAEAAGKKRVGFCVARLKGVRARVHLLQREQMMHQASPQRGPQLFTTRSAGNEWERARRLCAAVMAVAGRTRALENMPWSTSMMTAMMMRTSVAAGGSQFPSGLGDDKSSNKSGQLVIMWTARNQDERRPSRNYQVKRIVAKALVLTGRLTD